MGVAGRTRTLNDGIEGMTVTINGETRDVAPGTTLLEMLQHLGLNSKTLVVQRNGEIVPREEYMATVLAEGDDVDLIRFVGGG